MIAEEVLREPAEHLHRTVDLWRIELALAPPFLRIGGALLHPDPVERAAICCSRILRYHPFPRGNKQIAYLTMRVMLEWGGTPWPLSPQGDAELGDVIAALAMGMLSEEEFVAWMKGGGRE